MKNLSANDCLKVNKLSWDAAAERFFGRTALPEYGPYALTEDELNLFGDVKNRKVLDIGCGSGHSLKYMESRGAKEIWGLDLSSKQIDTAQKLLGEAITSERLFESPMEEDPGLPHNYFDIVYSIFALGWTVDLNKTLANVSNYLKPGGLFIFSWEHPLHNRLKYDGGSFAFDKSYTVEERWLLEAWNPLPAYLEHRKLSTYINGLINAGFIIEQVIDEVKLPSQSAGDPSRWYSYEKAQLVPATFIIKSRKTSSLTL